MVTNKGTLFEHVLLPVASVSDARDTARAVLARLPGLVERVTIVTVVERSQGWPDIVPKNYRMELGEEALETAKRLFEQEGVAIETRLQPAYDTAMAIHEMAEDIGATAIIFTPRDKGRLADFFTGDTSWQLIKKAKCPVLVVPPEADSQDVERTD